MTAHLLDVNVLVALLWPAHEDHQKVQNWFARHAKYGWATCPFTQAAVVRILSHPAFSRDAVSPQQAAEVLRANLEHHAHQFWSDNIGFVEAIEPVRKRLTGHQQVTDAYLLGLALHRKGKLATLDRAILALLPEGGRDAGPVVLV